MILNAVDSIQDVTGAFISLSTQLPSTPLSYLLKSHFNTIIPSTPRSSKWYLSDNFFHQITVYISSLPIRATCTAPLILLDFITQNRFLRSTDHEAFHFTQFSSVPCSCVPLRPNIFPRHSLAHAFPSTGETKFHTHIKQTKTYFPLCAQNYRCHKMFPAVRWMFTEWGFLNQSSSRYKIKCTQCGRSTVTS